MPVSETDTVSLNWEQDPLKPPKWVLGVVMHRDGHYAIVAYPPFSLCHHVGGPQRRVVKVRHNLLFQTWKWEPLASEEEYNLFCLIQSAKRNEERTPLFHYNRRLNQFLNATRLMD